MRSRCDGADEKGYRRITCESPRLPGFAIGLASTFLAYLVFPLLECRQILARVLKKLLRTRHPLRRCHPHDPVFYTACRSAASLAHHRGKRSIAFLRGLDVPLRPERIAAGSGDVPRPPTLYDQPVRLVDCPTRLIDRPPRLINQSTALAAVLVHFLG